LRTAITAITAIPLLSTTTCVEQSIRGGSSDAQGYRLYNYLAQDAIERVV
jgi:hypothetical protein